MRTSTYFLPTARRAAALALLCLSVVGCDSNDPDEPAGVGSFSITVAGDAQASLAGQAAYAVGTEDGETITAIGLVDDSDEEDVLILILPGSPRAATFSVDADAGGILLLTDGDTGSFYGTTSGTVTLTDVSGGRLEGRIDVVATSFDEVDEVTIKGTFEAELGDVDAEF